MDVLAEMLSAIEPGNREVRRFTSRERYLYLIASVDLVQNILRGTGIFLYHIRNYIHPSFWTSLGP